MSPGTNPLFSNSKEIMAALRKTSFAVKLLLELQSVLRFKNNTSEDLVRSYSG